MTIITKDPSDPFWVAMVDGAKKEAESQNVEITVAAGKDQTDSDGQIQAIENATARGDAAILIANNGPAVNDAIKKAQDAGVLVLALDTPFSPANLATATYATDNFAAGQAIGKWAAASLEGEKAVIAMLDLFADKVVSVDYQRDQGFLDGMGIALGDPEKIGDEAKTGTYSGGEYEIACHEYSDGAQDGGRTAMEKCLSLNPNINVVYTSNTAPGLGAYQALKAANVDALLTSINGACEDINTIIDGKFGAGSQQFPGKMGAEGVKAAVEYVRSGTKPTTDNADGFIDTGVELVTDQPVAGLESVTGAEAMNACTS
ncbi:substrate-binding domain-containing protein [Mycetocola miduiensis]|uniref:substrate-binding domain-containing protein n=1 Tax=Mycetocola miduiensis TaxID=995034 RepID=UPI001C431A70|nr:substrate-binding domain-containing protein [Mycetocola miduiensis]